MVPNCSLPNCSTILYCGLYMLYIQLHCGLYMLYILLHCGLCMIYILLYCGLYMINILLYIINSYCLAIYLYFRSRLLKSNIFSLLSKIEFLQKHTWSLLCVTFGYLCDIFCCLPSSKYICYLQDPDDETIKKGQCIHKGYPKKLAENNLLTFLDQCCEWLWYVVLILMMLILLRLLLLLLNDDADNNIESYEWR